jgi:hypothetical protein
VTAAVVRPSMPRRNWYCRLTSLPDQLPAPHVIVSPTATVPPTVGGLLLRGALTGSAA